MQWIKNTNTLINLENIRTLYVSGNSNGYYYVFANVEGISSEFSIAGQFNTLEAAQAKFDELLKWIGDKNIFVAV